MNRLLRVSAAASAATVALAALCVAPAFAGHKPPPDAGTWSVKVVDLEGKLHAEGSFKVAKNHKSVSGFHLKLTAAEETPCGNSGSVTVKGKLKLFEAKGSGEYGSYDHWIVGLNRPYENPVVQPEKVTMIRDGKKSTAKLEIGFVGRKGHSKEGNAAGNLYYRHGTCDIEFDVHKA